MSHRVYDQLSSQLHPTNEKVKGFYGPNHSPLGKCTMKVFEAIYYDVIGDNFEEELLLDGSILHSAQLLLRFETQELTRKGKVLEGVATI